MKEREISANCEIGMYLHCGECLKERPKSVSPQEFASLEVGFTKIGLQVWCSQHMLNVCHIDFEDCTHPANTSKT